MPPLRDVTRTGSLNFAGPLRTVILKGWRDGKLANVQARLRRERKTIRLMIGIYCRSHHHTTGALCDSCSDLHAYAMQRIEKCPFQDNKPTCAKCPVHCYKPSMREQVRQVMRYAGPRMLIHHPVLALLHMHDEKTITRELKRGGG